MTLKFKDENTETFQKQAVSKVLAYRPVSERKSFWLTLGLTFAAWQALVLVATANEGGDIPMGAMFGSHLMITLPISAAVFFGSRMGNIYHVPAMHRDSAWADGLPTVDPKKNDNPK